MTKPKGKLIAPAITGKFGKWRYYQIILSVEELVRNLGTSEEPDYRIKAVEEVEEIYSKKGVSNLLQRAFDTNRLDPIKNYILNQPDKYINNLTLAVFGGSPKWLDIRLSKDPQIDKELLDRVQKKIGFIEFNGSEVLFVLDGQHRLKGLRKAFLENPTKISAEEVVCTLIVHTSDNEGRIRTRRLFSTVNRQAKPVSAGENYLLDEDDASAIILRNLIENYKHFKGNEVVALSKTGNITKADYSKFTTVVTLYEVNEKIIEHGLIYEKVDGKILKIRPDEEKLLIQNKRVFSYWDKIFSIFPSALTFIKDTKANRIKARQSGGNFILRPIAQIAIAEVLLYCDKFDSGKTKKLKELPLDLNEEFWHYVLWDPHKSTMLFNRGHVKTYIKYNIGIKLRPSELSRLKQTYKKNSGELKLELPAPSLED